MPSLQSPWESSKQLLGSGKLELLVLLNEQQNPTVAKGDCCQLGHLLCSLVPKEGTRCASASSACCASVLGTRIIGDPRGNVPLSQSIAAGILEEGVGANLLLGLAGPEGEDSGNVAHLCSHCCRSP